MIIFIFGLQNTNILCDLNHLISLNKIKKE
ncbi:hypothetical protein F965_02945 [Acinetobacter schindleri NIPH 900]|jgi:hypothetical protein|uniref:Uncharacterized protein n=1 Tax=Acinetobacter schindleri NIPH 900 TaxID=1217675 RepID=N8XWY1_9GAMM|nr:hypothetical protein F965_02945 [Acinetobacter schindleri NIPH 900]